MGIVSIAQAGSTQYGTLDEKLYLVMTMALVGMVIVFLMLIAIVIAIVSMSRILRSLQKSVLNENPLSSATPVLSNDEKHARRSASIASEKIDPSLVAVIAAAVAMMMTDPAETPLLYPGFRVKSIWKIQ